MAIPLPKNTTLRMALANTIDIDGAIVTDATVQTTLYTSEGSEVSGQTWPATLAHDANGNYYATISNTIDVDVGRRYYFETIAVSGVRTKTWRTNVTFQYDTD